MTLSVLPPYRHDIHHTLLGRATATAVLLVALAGITSAILVDSATSDFQVDGSALAYYSSGEYHLSGWAYDAAGASIPGVTVSFFAYTSTSPNSSVGPFSSTTNSQGEFTLGIPITNDPGAYLLLDAVHLATSRSLTVVWQGIFGPSGSWQLGYLQPGQVEGLNPLVTSGTDFYSAGTQVMVFAAGLGNTLPTGLSVETCAATSVSVPPPNCSGLPTRVLGALTSYWNHFALPLYPGTATSILVQLVNSSGSVLAVKHLVPTQTDSGTTSVVNAAPGAPILSNYFAVISLLLPLTAFLSVYWAYARPRLSGAGDEVLARSVTRRGLFLSRYFSVGLVVSLAAITDTLMLDAAADWILGEPLPVGFLWPLIGSSVAAVIGFSSLFFLASHLLPTPGSHAGCGIALVGFGYFWPSVVRGILALNSPAFTSLNATILLTQSQLALPPQFMGLVITLLTGVSPFGVPVVGDSGVVGFGALAVAGTAWILLPLMAGCWLAVKRD